VPHPGSILRTCAALVGLQALGLVAVAVFYLVELVVADTDDAVRALVTVGLALAAGVGLGLVARGLLQRRRWARSPALVTNLLVLPVAIGLLQGGRWYVGAPLLVWALAVLGLLFAPATAAALDED
jgi:O-antigen/teichoic acid export membrane protein